MGRLTITIPSIPVDDQCNAMAGDIVTILALVTYFRMSAFDLVLEWSVAPIGCISSM